MKTYEEMARDVLKRRDEELRKLGITQNETHNYTPDKAYPAGSNKRRLLPRILIPCGAAITVAAVGFVVFNNSPISNNVNRLTANIGKPRPETNGAVNGANSDGNVGDIDIAVPTIADKYKGGETEINYNDIGEFVPYVRYYMNSNEPTYKDKDFVAIPDNEINDFYSIKFDRLNEVLGEGEHDPFGYHNQDVESDGVTDHSIYGVNSIHYTSDDGLGGFGVTVSASFEKQTNAAELYSGLAPEAAKNAKPSVINGFNAVVYEKDGGELIAEIDMGGVYVTISAAGIDEVYRDGADYENFKKIFETYLLNYTAPITSKSADKFADVYKGGETEINYNKITEENLCIYNLPDLGHDDFVTIPDDEINEFYGLKFDRLNAFLEESEHEPFGYYNHDIVSGGVVEHSVHGYYDNNGITYNCGDCKINVRATYGTFYTAHVDNAKKSVINGFDATVYEAEDGNLCADIDMNGVLVTIGASFDFDKINDESYPKNYFEKILESYTAPVDDNTEDGDKINMLDKYPDFLYDSDNAFAQLCWSEVIGLKIETIDIDKANELYGVQLDILGKLHEDWKEEGKNALEIYYSKPQDELIELGRPNKLSYCKPNGARLEVSASTRKISIPNNKSYINGRTSVLYCADSFERSKTDDEYPNGDHEYYGIVNFDKCSVELYSRGLTEKEFINVLREFTEKKYVTDVHYGNPSPTEIHYVETDSFIQTPDAPNLDEKDFNQLTIKELNRYYGWELDRLGTKHSDWSAKSSDFGYYKRGEEVYYSRNTITYTTDNGGTVTVSAQKERFNSPINFDYYAEPSHVNDYKAVVYVDKNGDFLADLDMNSYVRIKASGISKDEFENILCEFTELYGYDFVE